MPAIRLLSFLRVPPNRGGLAIYPQLARRIAVITPKAFWRLSTNPVLIRQLNDHFLKTGKLDVETLKKWHFWVERFLGSSTHFMIASFLPQERLKELHLIRGAVDSDYSKDGKLITDHTGLIQEIFKILGTDLEGAKFLKRKEQIRKLLMLIGVVIKDPEMKNTYKITILPPGASPHIIKLDTRTDGKSSYFIPVDLLQLPDIPPDHEEQIKIIESLDGIH